MKEEENMNIRKDHELLRHALAEGIRTVAELAAWLKHLDSRQSVFATGLAQA